ncbi:glycoside hydrolase family 55 protein [Lentinula edodes]|uniref:Glycoside hydrolase family 55 protein n=1 Tax=Lentinula edodes TaxID=5353 RepID=A0A1Q3EGM9_LENED|nr:glycoside hydrolase family 55 protein [Lentinula edodes]
MLADPVSNGTSPFNLNTTYAVYRSVKDYGAKGDGVTDDSAAFNLAISDGGRCGGGTCQSSTTTGAVVYVPRGVYLLKKAITPYYMTQLLGDARDPPTLLADESFRDMAVIDADPYIPGGGGAQWFTNQNNFYRTVKNFIIDVRRIPASLSQGTGIHWQVAQATSLQNIKFYMSEDLDTAHQGIWMENGSGGFMSDLTFYGGKFGMWVGNQQFTVQNVTMNNCKTAVFGIWNWGWTFQGITINNCGVGFDLLTGGTTSATQSVASETIIDAVVNNTPYFVRSSNTNNKHLSGSLVLINAQLNNVSVAVSAINQTKPLLAGTSGSMNIAAWGQGNVYKGSSPSFEYMQGNIEIPRISESLLDGDGRIFSKGRPQYEDYSLDQIVSAKDNGAKGDGKTDDTKALQTLLNESANRKIIFLDAGVYLITTTLLIPAGTRLTGEVWSTISATGSYFANQENPQVVVRVGEEGSQGVVEITDILFSTKGAAPGAILVEWNVRDPEGTPAGAGMWDTHFRIGGGHCVLGVHVRNHTHWDLYGCLGPHVTEHHVIYQYRLVNAKNHYLGLVQTESPYHQPKPAAPYPFSLSEAFADPKFPDDLKSAWSISVARSKNIVVLGAGFYSFFNNYVNSCSHDKVACQSQITDIDSESSIQLISVSTVGVQYPISVNQKGVALRKDNINGFAETVTAWTSS